MDEVLDTVMLPVGGDLDDRCQHLLEVYLNLTEDGQKALLNMIKDKLRYCAVFVVRSCVVVDGLTMWNRFRADLLKWIDTKGSSKKAVVTFAAENPEVVASYKSVLKYFPGHEDESAAVRALDSMSRDLIESLRVLATEVEYAECRESKVRLGKQFGVIRAYFRDTELCVFFARQRQAGEEQGQGAAFLPPSHYTQGFTDRNAEGVLSRVRGAYREASR